MPAARADRKLLRILDANFNRAREGLRVCEDVVRLGYDHRLLTQQLKRLRHGLNRAAGALPVSWRELLDARSSGSDVGRAQPHLTSQREAGIKTLFRVNAQRAKEALRVLEEAARTFSPKAAKQFSRLRFRLYGIEKRFARDC